MNNTQYNNEFDKNQSIGSERMFNNIYRNAVECVRGLIVFPEDTSNKEEVGFFEKDVLNALEIVESILYDIDGFDEDQFLKDCGLCYENDCLALIC